MPNQEYLWFPQIPSPDSTGSPDPVSLALRAFCNLFWNDSHIVESPLTSLNLPQLLKAIQEQKQPICVIGTFSDQGQASRHSWEQLGLDLFDLPWHSPDKVFKYIPLLQLSKHFQDLQNCLLVSNENNLAHTEAWEQLKWAKCHQFARSIQTAVGHGNRDEFQNPRMTWERICSDINRIYQSYSDCPCGDRCGLQYRIQDLLKQSDVNEQKRLKLAQQVAALDCRTYRLAPTQYFVLPNKQEIPKFKKIIILENNDQFRQSLQEALQIFLDKNGKIILADPKKSQELFRLCDDSGKDLIAHYINKEQIESIAPGEILTCFDLDLGRDNIPESGMKDFMGDIFGGHWVMYGTASQYPNVPRLIITGFRSEDLLGYTAGGCAYLLKPFTEKTLKAQVIQASVLHRVKWLCPQVIQDDYSKLLEKTTFDKFHAFLDNWLDQKRIELEIIQNCNRNAIAESDLIIVDLFTNQGTHTLNLLKAIAKIRYYNNNTCLLVVLPSTENVENTVSDYYRKLPLALRDGSDAIIKKPMWLVNNGHSNPEDALGNLIIKQLQRLNEYDVKYQIIVPVAAIVGRYDNDFIYKVKSSESQPSKDADKLYAPLIPLLVNAYGLSANLGDIAKLGDRLKQDLQEKIREEWQGERNDGINAVSSVTDRFIEVILDKSIQEHLTLEAWLRASVDRKVNNKFKDINTITQPLTKVFGGATRYEFSVRGSWYKGANQIDDLLIVIEFCAKSSLIARKFIETTVVRYLREIAGEDCVLVQEIPIRGYLL